MGAPKSVLPVDMRIPGLQLREPIRRRPIAFGLVGAGLGAIWGDLGAPEYDLSVGTVVLRHMIGCLAAGSMIGGLLPLFRHRVAAGVIVAVAAFLGLMVAWGPSYGMEEEILGFIAASWGLVYAVLFWDYE